MADAGHATRAVGGRVMRFECEATLYSRRFGVLEHGDGFAARRVAAGARASLDLLM